MSRLVSAKDMLIKARDGKYAVAQININNLEWTKAVLQTVQELKAPVILGVSEGAGKYMCGFKTVEAMVSAMMDSLDITVPVALHLDHGTFEGAKACINAGFSSIMFDGSHYPIAENIEKTTALVHTCDVLGLSLEAEVGSIGGEEDGVVGMGECADPDECKAVADLGVTMLAAGIGNIHGKYPANWPGLRFDVLEAIKAKTGDMPLVLHGGTGIPDDMIQKAISLGVAKINVNTECQLVFQEATRKYIEEGKDLQGKGFDPRKLLNPGFEAIKAKVAEKSKDYITATNIYEELIANGYWKPEPYNRLLYIYDKAGLTNGIKELLVLAISFFENQQKKQKQELLRLADKYKSRAYAEAKINQGKTVAYFDGFFEIYMPFPDIDVWKRILAETIA